MNDSRWRGPVAAVVFLVCLAMVVVGQQTTGWFYLGIQLVGLAGLLTLLWSYNRRFR